jgi:hypothetical protein
MDPPEVKTQLVVEKSIGSTIVLDQALARIGRFARVCLGVEEGGIVLGVLPAREPASTAGFQYRKSLHGRDGHLLGTLWLRHSTQRGAVSAVEEALLADIADSAVEALEHQQEIASLALRERLLRLVVDAPSFALAVERAMAELRRQLIRCCACSFVWARMEGICSLWPAKPARRN